MQCNYFEIKLRFLHAVCVFQELILLVSSISSDGYYTICLYTQLLMGISCFHILDITNKAAMKLMCKSVSEHMNILFPFCWINI